MRRKSNMIGSGWQFVKRNRLYRGHRRVVPTPMPPITFSCFGDLRIARRVLHEPCFRNCGPQQQRADGVYAPF